MKLLAALIGALLALVWCAASDAHTARVHVPVEVQEEQCPGVEDLNVVGCYFEQPVGKYNVFWSDQDPLTLRHEFGHVYDATSLTPASRQAFLTLFRLGGEWEEFRQGVAGEFSPSEWFAEAYARCGLHYPAYVYTAYGYAPTREQHRAACRIIWTNDATRASARTGVLLGRHVERR